MNLTPLLKPFNLKYLITLSFSLLLQLACQAQPYTPISLTQKIFSADSFPDLKKYCTGEYQGRPNGQDLPPGAKVSCTLLAQNNRTAVVNVNLTNSSGQTYDMYLHLKKDSVWKAAAFRALALTGIIEEINRQLKLLSPKQVDSIIAAPGKAGKLFKSRAEYEFMLGNTTLTLASDSQLVAHFTKNKATFESLKNDLLKNGILKLDGSAKRTKNPDAMMKSLKDLRLESAFREREEVPHNINFLIGGIIDNSVGYLYIPKEQNVPKMSPGEYIMIRKIVDGWYLYKTT
ncbi:hypothetical protein [Mucilaginibacter sp. CSA2-8R]|uniref:hypothetical protein n=1 Tax=Mucilaginibacter sp. CSA2-8R TaxID=3141542 RepID=UPI00315D4C8A